MKRVLLRKGRDSGHARGTVLYDGFEPSRRTHIGQGLFKAINVNKCIAEGTNATFVFWIADWFAMMNDKIGGDLEIHIVGDYLQKCGKLLAWILAMFDF